MRGRVWHLRRVRVLLAHSGRHPKGAARLRLMAGPLMPERPRRRAQRPTVAPRWQRRPAMIAAAKAERKARRRGARA